MTQADFGTEDCARGFLSGDTTVSVQWLSTTERDMPSLPSHPAVVVVPPCSGISTCWFG